MNEEQLDEPEVSQGTAATLLECDTTLYQELPSVKAVKVGAGFRVRGLGFRV